MTRVSAGERVEAGYYFSTQTWRLHPVARSGERLPGAPGEGFLAVPVWGAFLLAPVLGAAFLVFLPVIGFCLTAVAAIGPARRLGHRLATGFAATVEPGWEPGHAHLTGKRSAGAGARQVTRHEPDALEELEREISALRAARRRA